MDFVGLKSVVKGKVLLAEPMSKHTTWRIGGNADCLFLPQSGEDLCTALDYARKNNIPVLVIGNGSNMLVLDGGIRGLVISIGEAMSSFSIEDNILTAEAGCILAKLARETAKMGYCGLEWGAGIPASVGGAAVMNAGAYGHFFYETLNSVEVIDRATGAIVNIPAKDLTYSYRSTSIMESGYIVTRVFVNLKPGNPQELTTKVEDILASRRAKQPLEYPSAGSVFKNPPNDHAGRLVEAAGLRGMRRGDAQVSEKHGNFIVNLGSATAQEVLSLIDDVRNIVKEKFDVLLEPEVRLIGEE